MAERQRQERRRNALQLLDKVVYFFTTEDVFDDPAYVLGTLDRCLLRAAQLVTQMRAFRKLT